MPIIETDNWGIKYYVNFNEGNHSLPHIHIKYKDSEASISINDGKVLAGNIKSKIEKRAKEYIKNNKEELLKFWKDSKLGYNSLNKGKSK